VFGRRKEPKDWRYPNAGRENCVFWCIFLVMTLVVIFFAYQDDKKIDAELKANPYPRTTQLDDMDGCSVKAVTPKRYASTFYIAKCGDTTTITEPRNKMSPLITITKAK